MDHSGDGQEPVDSINVLLDGFTRGLEHGILHQVLQLHKELLQLSDLVGLLGCLLEVEPGALALGCLVVVLLDDFLDLGDPGLLQVVALLRDSRGLNLIELINGESLRDVRVEDVTISCLATLLVDLLLSSDNLLLDLEGLEAVLGESLSERVMRLGDADHAKVRRKLLRHGRGQIELTGDEALSTLVQVLVEDDVVHGLGEVSVDLVQKSGRVG